MRLVSTLAIAAMLLALTPFRAGAIDNTWYRTFCGCSAVKAATRELKYCYNYDDHKTGCEKSAAACAKKWRVTCDEGQTIVSWKVYVKDRATGQMVQTVVCHQLEKCSEHGAIQ
jgi:hypothetical protein